MFYCLQGITLEGEATPHTPPTSSSSKGHNPRLQLAYPGTITSLYITPCYLRYELSELSTTNLEFSNFSEALNPPDSVAVVVVVFIKTGEKYIAIFAVGPDDIAALFSFGNR